MRRPSLPPISAITEWWDAREARTRKARTHRPSVFPGHIEAKVHAGVLGKEECATTVESTRTGRGCEGQASDGHLDRGIGVANGMRRVKVLSVRG